MQSGKEMQMDMETLLANLHLTGISSAREVVGYGHRAAQVMRSDIRAAADPDVDRESQTDDDEPFCPDLWEGECG